MNSSRFPSPRRRTLWKNGSQKRTKRAAAARKGFLVQRCGNQRETTEIWEIFPQRRLPRPRNLDSIAIPGLNPHRIRRSARVCVCRLVGKDNELLIKITRSGARWLRSPKGETFILDNKRTDPPAPGPPPPLAATHHLTPDGPF